METESFFHINIGAVIEIVTLLLSIGGVIWAFRGRLDNISSNVRDATKRLTDVEVEMKQMTTVLVALGRQDERMNAIDARMLLSGQRFDELVSRFNKFTDNK
jgi:hypothetical protein